MKSILAILAATALIAPGAMAQVDEDFGVREPGPVATSVRAGEHPIARILFFPLMPFIELQAGLSPEKDSCWNDGAANVVGCDVVETIEEAQANRPTPYAD